MVNNSNETADSPRIARLGIVAALIGALGGGLISGVVTNYGIAQQFANERGAQVDDLRRESYVSYLRVVEAAYRADAGMVNEEELRASEAVVLLLATPEVRQGAGTLTRVALEGDEQAQANGLPLFTDARNQFIDSAQREREATSGVAVFPWLFPG